MSKLGSMMRAVALKSFGPSSNMGVVRAEMPTPLVGHTGKQCVVKVMSAGVNRADILQRKGAYPPPEGEDDRLGLEIAGRIVSVSDERSEACSADEATQGFNVGDRVMALVQGGGYAEYAVIPETLCMAIPNSLDYNQAACVPEAWLTAYQHLSLSAGFHKQDTVLIHGGASGVGLAATQLSAFMGKSKRIISTVRTPTKAQVCTSAGAGHVVVPGNGKFSEKVMELTKGRGVDVILDCVGAAYWQENIKSAACDCRWVVYGMLGGRKDTEGFDIAPFMTKRMNLCFTTLRSRSEVYRGELINSFTSDILNKGHFDDGTFKVFLDKTFPLESVCEAHDYMEANKNAGKIVLEVSNDDSI